VHPVGVQPVHRVTQDGDQLGLGQVLGDPAARVAVVEVERRALPRELLLAGGREQVEVPLALPDPLAVAVRVAGPGVRRRWRVAAEVVLRLLDLAEEQLRMPGECRVQRRRTRLGCAEEQEVGKPTATEGLGGAGKCPYHRTIVYEIA
jgi:hypothetical protein